MNYLKVILLGVVNTEPEDSINYRIAACLLENIDAIGGYSATQIASLCNVSKAAVSRFCRHIGLEDFLDLQLMYRQFAVSNGKKFCFPEKNQSSSIVEDYFVSAINDTERLMKTIDTDVLLSLVDDLAAYKNVAAFGHMQSGNVAHTLQHDLTDANKFIFSSHRFGRQKEYILAADRQTLLIIFSSSGTYFDRMFQSDLRNCAKITLHISGIITVPFVLGDEL